MIVYRPAMRGFGDQWDNLTEATSLIPTSTGSAYVGTSAGGGVISDGPGGLPWGPSSPGSALPTPGMPSGLPSWLTNLVGGSRPQPMYQPPPSNTGLYIGAAALGAAVIYFATRQRA